MTIKHKIPTVREPIISPTGEVANAWYRYLSGIEEIAVRMDGVSDTTGSETLAQLITKVQEILDALKTE